MSPTPASGAAGKRSRASALPKLRVEDTTRSGSRSRSRSAAGGPGSARGGGSRVSSRPTTRGGASSASTFYRPGGTPRGDMGLPPSPHRRVASASPRPPSSRPTKKALLAAAGARRRRAARSADSRASSSSGMSSKSVSPTSGTRKHARFAATAGSRHGGLPAAGSGGGGGGKGLGTGSVAGGESEDIGGDEAIRKALDRSARDAELSFASLNQAEVDELQAVTDDMKRHYNDVRRMGMAKREELRTVVAELMDLRRSEEEQCGELGELSRRSEKLEEQRAASEASLEEASQRGRMLSMMEARLKRENLALRKEIAKLTDGKRAAHRSLEEAREGERQGEHQLTVGMRRLAAMQSRMGDHERLQVEWRESLRKLRSDHNLYMQKKEERLRQRREMAWRVQNNLETEKADHYRKLFVARSLYGALLTRRMVAQRKQQQALEDAFRRVTEVTGLVEAEDIVHKFITRTQTVESLESQVADARARIAALHSEHGALKARLHDLVEVAGEGFSGKRAIYNEIDQLFLKLQSTKNAFAEKKRVFHRAKIIVHSATTAVTRMLELLHSTESAAAARVAAAASAAAAARHGSSPWAPAPLASEGVTDDDIGLAAAAASTVIAHSADAVSPPVRRLHLLRGNSRRSVLALKSQPLRSQLAALDAMALRLSASILAHNNVQILPTTLLRPATTGDARPAVLPPSGARPTPLRPGPPAASAAGSAAAAAGGGGGLKKPPSPDAAALRRGSGGSPRGTAGGRRGSRRGSMRGLSRRAPGSSAAAGSGRPSTSDGRFAATSPPSRGSAGRESSASDGARSSPRSFRRGSRSSAASGRTSGRGSAGSGRSPSPREVAATASAAAAAAGMGDTGATSEASIAERLARMAAATTVDERERLLHDDLVALASRSSLKDEQCTAAWHAVHAALYSLHVLPEPDPTGFDIRIDPTAGTTEERLHSRHTHRGRRASTSGEDGVMDRAFFKRRSRGRRRRGKDSTAAATAAPPGSPSASAARTYAHAGRAGRPVAASPSSHSAAAPGGDSLSALPSSLSRGTAGRRGMRRGVSGAPPGRRRTRARGGVATSTLPSSSSMLPAPAASAAPPSTRHASVMLPRSPALSPVSSPAPPSRVPALLHASSAGMMRIALPDDD
eukprot:PLAT12513.11.p1 GENE.PLAT12513.11~~PLAT12513.11.p1  ORF type:complete len:1146 (+),score=490.72 PLAT12513.11:28-3438(+)